MLWKALEKALRFAFTNSKKTRERSCSSFVFCVVGALGISWRFFSYFRRTAFGWASGPSEKSPGQSGKKKTWWNFYFYLPFILLWKALEKALRFAFTSSKNSRTARRSHLHSFFKKEMKALPFCFEARKKSGAPSLLIELYGNEMGISDGRLDESLPSHCLFRPVDRWTFINLWQIESTATHLLDFKRMPLGARDLFYYFHFALT